MEGVALDRGGAWDGIRSLVIVIKYFVGTTWVDLLSHRANDFIAFRVGKKIGNMHDARIAAKDSDAQRKVPVRVAQGCTARGTRERHLMIAGRDQTRNVVIYVVVDSSDGFPKWVGRSVLFRFARCP